LRELLDELNQDHERGEEHVTTTQEEMTEAVARALADAEREKSVSPVERMAAGYEQSEEVFRRAVDAEAARQGRPLAAHEEKQVRKSLAGREGGPR
jgi:hypothetical protein